MTEDQIKHMANRFLGWPLPKNFFPDGGITFEPKGNKGTPHEYDRNPQGTNLFDCTQAEAMVRYLVEGLPERSRLAEGAGMTDDETNGESEGRFLDRTAYHPATENVGTEMTERDAWAVCDKVFFHLNDGDNGTAIEFIRALIAETSARATAAERERCVRWHDHQEADHRKIAKYLANAGLDADAADADAIAEEHKISAAAHRAGEGE